MCLLKHEGESSNDIVVSVWGNLHSLSPVAMSSSITHLARTKSLPTHLQHHVGAADVYVSIASLRRKEEKKEVGTQSFHPEFSFPLVC